MTSSTHAAIFAETQHPSPGITGLIAAAGWSSRMPTHKALLPFGPHVFFTHLIHTFWQAGVTTIDVTVPALPLLPAWHRAMQQAALVDHAFCENTAQRRAPSRQPPPPVRFVLNDAPDDGLLGSIRTAIALPQRHALPLLLTPVDTPFITAALIRALLQSAHAPYDAIIPTWAGQRGHPVLLLPSAFARVRGETPQTGGLARILTELRVCELPWEDARILANINTVTDYQHLCTLSHDSA